jgi:hypothetical protein
VNVHVIQGLSAQLTFHLLEGESKFIIGIELAGAGIPVSEIYTWSYHFYFGAQLKHLFQGPNWLVFPVTSGLIQTRLPSALNWLVIC